MWTKKKPWIAKVIVVLPFRMKNSPIDMDYQLIYIFNDAKKIRIWFRSNLVVSVLHCVYFIKRWENDLVNKLEIRFFVQLTNDPNSMIMWKVISTMCIELVYIERVLQWTCSYINQFCSFMYIFFLHQLAVVSFIIVLHFFPL